MGRITIFTSDDIHSKFLKKEFDRNYIPYTEISVARFPRTLYDLLGLAHTTAVPQVFFNERCVGGVTETLRELRIWRDNSRYRSLYNGYWFEIKNLPDPIDIRLDPPDDPFDSPDGSETSLSDDGHTLSIDLPDGTFTSVRDITEKLKNTFPKHDCTFKGTVYTNAFTGKEAVEKLQKHLALSEQEAVTFGQYLQDSCILDHVHPSTLKSTCFKNSEKEVYRLQCFRRLDILNSYRIWKEKPSSDSMSIVARLDSMFTEMQQGSMDDEGRVDYEKVLYSSDFAAFEDAVCELQKIDLVRLSDTEAKVLGINVYRLMIRYAFAKMEMIEVEADRLAFLKTAKFIVGGHTFSFREWIDGILRGNRKSSIAPTVPFNRLDSRRKYALGELDYKIHFALNAGVGWESTYSLPFAQFTVDNVYVELELSAFAFCSQLRNVDIDLKTRLMYLSSVFDWYRKDFASNDLQLLETIDIYIGGYKKLCMKQARREITCKNADKAWDINFCNPNTYQKELIELPPAKKGVVALVMSRFQPPKFPDNERIRIRTLRSLNLLDTFHEERFDRITRMVKETYQVPVVFVALMDECRNWIKSVQWGLPCDAVTESPREISFCGHTINNGENDIMIVENALEDDRFAENPLVTGPLGARFYAGYALSVPAHDGGLPVNVGTLCVFDLKPRVFTDEQVDQFRSFGYMVKKEILRRDSLK